MRPRMIYGSVYNTRVIVGGRLFACGLRDYAPQIEEEDGGKNRDVIDWEGITNVEYRFRCKWSNGFMDKDEIVARLRILSVGASLL